MSSIDKHGKADRRGLREPMKNPASHKPQGDEFPPGASTPPDKPSRRHFLKLMAASTAMAGTAGCRWPKEEILPYTRRPPEITPGEAIHFATSTDIAGSTQGLLVSSYDGRPTKIEGNPLHPNNRGATSAAAQASVLDLYDPDRSKVPVQRQRGRPVDQNWDGWNAFVRDHFAPLREAGGKGLCVLSESSSSPSVRAMRQRLLEVYPQARWYEYEPISQDHLPAGATLAMGQPVRTHCRFDQAAVVVSLDADFLMTHPMSLRYARDFIQAHMPTAAGPAAGNGHAGAAPADTPQSSGHGASTGSNGSAHASPGAADGAHGAAHPAGPIDYRMSRLYVAESSCTTTGAMADHRLATPAGMIPQTACQLAAALVDAGLKSEALPAPLIEAARKQAGQTVPPLVQAMARDLLANRGKSIVIAGAQHPPEVHALVHALNAALDNAGKTVWYSPDPDADRIGHIEAIARLAEQMRAGQVDTLLILGANPVYNAPADLRFAEAMAKVDTTVHFGLYWDETAQLCTWHVPRAHYLEAWGDTRAWDGTYAPAQPLIRPLYEGRSTIELLSELTDQPALSGYQIVRRTVRALYGEDLAEEAFETLWRRLLNDGVLPDTGFEPVSPELQPQEIARAVAQMPRVAPASDKNLELVFREDHKVYDGRLANNAWLQELPDIMTKVSWDNAVLIAPPTATALGIRQGEIVALRRGDRQVLGPAYIMPGQAPGSLTVALGYGRPFAGNVGRDVGFDGYALRTSDAMHVAGEVTIEPTGRIYDFAETQDHWHIDAIGRKGIQDRLENLMPEATLAQYRADPNWVHQRVHHPHVAQLWEPYAYEGYKWGMAIDLQRCIGCNACAVACQAENNVPVVGREQVRRQREMHWLRIDRYFRGQPLEPQVSFQPIFCVHCENAPCESVCPVAATLHDADGLNLMVYNRCVGTRYCSNNCPYKVRRFNFYRYTPERAPLRGMQYNPDVTVRSRGVMEKCTYCLQRIQRAKIQAKNERRPIRDGEFTTACAQTCPTGAIVFGDLNDPASLVARLHADNRAYSLLAHINTRPRTVHMGRVRNPAREETQT